MLGSAIVMVLPSLLIRTQPFTPKPGFIMQIPTKSSAKYCKPSSVDSRIAMAAFEALSIPEAVEEPEKIINEGSWLAMMFIAVELAA